jgi:hypothetical protein
MALHAQVRDNVLWIHTQIIIHLYHMNASVQHADIAFDLQYT